MKPKRIQLSRRKGWKVPPNSVKVDRTTKWGNPFNVRYYVEQVGYSEQFARDTACQFFRDCVTGKDEAINPDYQKKLDWIRENVSQLRGKNLACWCRPGELCHADVLLELANKAVQP